ncbi:hypothetical protein phiFa_80 [Thermus phage phiFa]|nr:hypothetical protein phiFa_80 [Thermus phage phiFa]
MDAVALVTVLAGLVVPIAELIGGRLLKMDGDKARLVSWAVGVLLGLGSGAIGLAPDLLQGGLLGFLAALVANGVFTIDQVKKLLEALKLREPEPATVIHPQNTGANRQSIDQRVQDILRGRK